MATSVQRGSIPDKRPHLKYRHDYDKHATEASRRQYRRTHGERHKEHSRRSPPPRQTQRPSPYQLLTPMDTPYSSTVSLIAQDEHVNVRSLPMERTPSGNSIVADNIYDSRPNHTLTCCSDERAARQVESHFKKRPPHSKQERYLRNLIDSVEPIDDLALDSIRTAVDVVFFGGYLKKRVDWEWSHQSDERYQTELIGTTALRPVGPDERNGYETLIVLSKPILRDPKYDRRLVLSTFIHELIHCYLFIRCGFEAKEEGGHTKGFHGIASLIDRWVGIDNLRLCNMKANLNHFRLPYGRASDHYVTDERHGHEGCNLSPRPNSGYQDAGVSGYT